MSVHGESANSVRGEDRGHGTCAGRESGRRVTPQLGLPAAVWRGRLPRSLFIRTEVLVLGSNGPGHFGSFGSFGSCIANRFRLVHCFCNGSFSRFSRLLDNCFRRGLWRAQPPCLPGCAVALSWVWRAFWFFCVCVVLRLVLFILPWVVFVGFSNSCT